jgi:hypothetical protein
MISDSKASEQGTRRRHGDLNEAEIGGATSDIDDQNQSHPLEGGGQVTTVACREIVKGRLRLFEEGEVFQTGLAGSADGQ